MNKLYLKYPIIVEGKYDKIKLDSLVASTVIAINGFSFFNNPSKQKLLRKYSENGAIILTDSDKAGLFIRSKLKGYTKGTLINLYTPAIKGKERRKSAPSKDGLLGVEGIPSEVLVDLLRPYESNTIPSGYLTKSRLFSDGLSGMENSADLRKQLAAILGLPDGLSSNAFIEAVNAMIPEEQYTFALNQIKELHQ